MSFSKLARATAYACPVVTHLELPHRFFVGLGRGLIGHLSLGDEIIHLLGEALDGVELGDRVLSSRRVVSALRKGLAFRGLPDEAPEFFCLFPDHAVSLLRARTYRARPKRSS